MKNFNNVCDVLDNSDDFEALQEFAIGYIAEHEAKKAAAPAEMTELEAREYIAGQIAAEKAAARNEFNAAFARKRSEKTDRNVRSELLYEKHLSDFQKTCDNYEAVNRGEAEVLKMRSIASDIVLGTRLVIRGVLAIVLSVTDAESRASGANKRVKLVFINGTESNLLMSSLLKVINGKNMHTVNASYRIAFIKATPVVATVIDSNDEILENNDEVFVSNDEVFECIGYSDGNDEVFECIGYSDGSDEIEYVDPDSVMDLNELWVGLACTPNAIRTWISMHDRHIYLREFGEADNLFDIITDVQRRCGFPLSTRDDRQCSIN